VADWESYVAPAARPGLRTLLGSVSRSVDTCLRGALEQQGQFIKLFHARGGRVVAGSDPVVPSLLPGYALHRELRNLVGAGLTPLAALQAASLTAAQVLGLDEQIGTIAAGKRADLVLVDGDPASDISAIGQTFLVFKDGIPYDPTALRAAARGQIGR
jgi:imidazolonepropionase-like amidohydrolase